MFRRKRYSDFNMDKSMLGDLDNLPEEDKLRMSSMIDQLQIRDRYNLDSSVTVLY